MDGRTGLLIGRVEEASDAIIGNDKFHEQAETDWEARQTRRTAGRAGVHRLRRVSLLDGEASSEQLEMLEKIRLAAGQTS